MKLAVISSVIVALLFFAQVNAQCETTVSLHAGDARFNLTLDCTGQVRWMINRYGNDPQYDEIYPMLGSITECMEGQTIVFNGVGNWSCSYPTIGNVPDTISQILPECEHAWVPRWNGTAWHCTADSNTCPLATITCTDGQMVQVTDTGYVCHTDQDGLSKISCVTDGLMLKNVSGKGWACANDIDTDKLRDKECSADGQILEYRSGDFQCAECRDTAAELCQVCAPDQMPVKTSTGWGCQDDVVTDLCGKITGCRNGDLVKVGVGNRLICARDEDSLGGLECPDSLPHPKSTGAGDGTFYCAADQNTDYLRFHRCSATGGVIKFNAATGQFDIPCGIDLNSLLQQFNCPKNYVLKWIANSWTCAPDLNSNILGDVTGCSDGWVLDWNNGWVCNPDGNVLGSILLDVSTGCAAGNGILKFKDSKWQCVVDDDELRDLGNSGSCANGQIAQFNGTEWKCIDLTDTLGGLDCEEGQTAKWSSASGHWECADDLNTDTALNLIRTLGAECDDKILKYVNGEWTCANDLNSDVLSQLGCEVGRWAVKDSTAPLGWRCSDAFTNTDTLAGLECTIGQIPVFDGSNWVCGTDQQCLPSTNNTLTVTPISLVTGGYSSFKSADVFIPSNQLVYNGVANTEPIMLYPGFIVGYGGICRFPDAPLANTTGTTTSSLRLAVNSTVSIVPTLDGALINIAADRLVLGPGVQAGTSGEVMWKGTVTFTTPVPVSQEQRVGFTMQTNSQFAILNGSSGSSLECQATFAISMTVS